MMRWFKISLPTKYFKENKKRHTIQIKRDIIKSKTPQGLMSSLNRILLLLQASNLFRACTVLYKKKKLPGILRNKEKRKKEKKDRNIIYIKQWLKTKHAIMFRLSNSIFQVNFFDKSQILLSTDKKIILFTSKTG